jgi:mRNA interferase MazF
VKSGWWIWAWPPKPAPLSFSLPTISTPPRSLIIHIPITRQNRGSELEVPLGHLPFLDPESVANVQAIGSLPSVRFEKRLGVVPETDLKKVKAALLKACAL